MGRAIALIAALAALATAGYYALRPADQPRQPDQGPRAESTAPRSAAKRASAAPGLRGPAAGRTERYRFEYRVEPDVDGNAMPVIRISGEWDQTPIDDGHLVRLSKVSLDEHEALPTAKSLESTFGLKAKDGVLDQLGFDGDADEATRRTFAALAATFWLSSPADEGALAWQVDESEMAGVFSAEYSRAGDRITKRIGGYTGLRGPDGLDARMAKALKTTGEVRFDVDARGVAKVSVDLTQIAQMDAESVKVTSRTKATLERIDSDLPPVTANDLRWGGFAGLVDYSGQQETMDAQRVGDANAASLLAQLTALDALPRGENATQQQRSALLKTMSALVRLEPAAAGQLAAELRARAKRGENTSLLAGALASAKSAAGTNALAELIGDSDLPIEARRNAMNTLGLAHQATAESIEALGEQLDSEMGSAAAMALGNQARRIADEAPEQAKTAVQQLIEGYERAQSVEEKVAYLRALGNTGAREALPIMTAAIASNDPTLKPIGISGLRFIPGDDVDAALKPFVFSGTLFGEVALEAVTWRSPAIWQPQLVQARAVYAKVESAAKLVEAIDRILARWSN